MATFTLTVLLTPLLDPETGLYLRLTAFTYAIQVFFAVCLASVIAWRLSYALGDWKHYHAWRVILKSGGGKLSLGLIFLCFGVINNRTTWLLKILFEDDKYGYSDVIPATNSIMSVATLILLMYAIRGTGAPMYSKFQLFLIYLVPILLSAKLVFFFDPA